MQQFRHSVNIAAWAPPFGRVFNHAIRMVCGKMILMTTRSHASCCIFSTEIRINGELTSKTEDWLSSCPARLFFWCSSGGCPLFARIFSSFLRSFCWEGPAWSGWLSAVPSVSGYIPWWTFFVKKGKWFRLDSIPIFPAILSDVHPTGFFVFSLCMVR